MLISQRLQPGGRVGHLAYGAWIEAEDVLSTITGDPIAVLDRHTHSPSIKARRVLGRGFRRTAGRGRLLPATRRTPRIGSDVEHVFLIAHGLWDLALLEQLRSLRRKVTNVSLWISEVWPSELQDTRLCYEGYNMINHIFVPHRDVVDPFARFAPGAEVHVLPAAVDVLRFAPPDTFGDRGIAVLGIGRRDPAQHAGICDWAERNGALYMFDTVRGRAVDWREHRDALANQYRHANVAVCNYAKHDVPDLIGTTRAIPGRLFEGLAAGAIMIGMPPDEQQQESLFGRTVVEVLDGTRPQLNATLDRLSDPIEVGRLRIQNLALACRGHDWSHRWKVALETVGVAVPHNLQDRIDDLAKRALDYEEQAHAR